MVSQTSVIFFGLLVGFIVFITVRGELPAYLDVVGLAGGSGGGASSSIGNRPAQPGGVSITAPPISVGGVTITAPTVRI